MIGTMNRWVIIQYFHNEICWNVSKNWRIQSFIAAEWNHLNCVFCCRTLYQKLREIIPSCQNKPVSSLDIILHAVEYINQLHQALEEEYPGLPKPISNLNFFDPSLLQLSTNPSENSIRDVTNVVSQVMFKKSLHYLNTVTIILR